MNFAKSNFINKNISQYFGFEPVVRYISVWLDRPNPINDESIYTQKFHRDHDDVKLVKVFYYLNDVGINNGPFQFIPNSHKHPWLEREKYNNINYFSAESEEGSLVVADTNGFHRGLKLKKGYRVLLSVSYSSLFPSVGFRKNIFN